MLYTMERGLLNREFHIPVQIVEKNKLKNNIVVGQEGRFQAIRLKPDSLYSQDARYLLPVLFFIYKEGVENKNIDFLNITSKHAALMPFPNAKAFYNDQFGKTERLTDYSYEGIPFTCL